MATDETEWALMNDVARLEAEVERLQEDLDNIAEQYARRMGEVARLREALHELRNEMETFTTYSRAVASDAAGQARLTWQERAEWADRLAQTARRGEKGPYVCGS